MNVMDELNVTWTSGLKIWWSFAWRAWLLMFIAMVPAEIVLFLIVGPSLTKGTPGHPVDMEALRHAMGWFPLFWLGMMAALIALQAQAMRWMLKKARWSDFRLALLPKT
jgi:hypothetical protein